jgi:hypothetical protein
MAAQVLPEQMDSTVHLVLQGSLVRLERMEEQDLRERLGFLVQMERMEPMALQDRLDRLEPQEQTDRMAQMEQMAQTAPMDLRDRLAGRARPAPIPLFPDRRDLRDIKESPEWTAVPQ